MFKILSQVGIYTNTESYTYIQLKNIEKRTWAMKYITPSIHTGVHLSVFGNYEHFRNTV